VNILLALSTALMLGVLHALEIDHMVAVTAFVSRRPALLTALGFGFRWGVGHSVAVLVAGAVLLASGLRWSPAWQRPLEAAVGLALISVGIWAVRATRNLHLHPPAEHGDHAHLHLHAGAALKHGHPHGATAPHPPHHHPKGITAVGLLHGLAGTSAAVALVPMTLVRETWVGLAYLAAFGVGVTVGMSAFALVAALALRHAAGTSIEWGRRTGWLAGVASLGVGLWWLGRAWLGG
jgi:cytochrome c biogenesis protein CcdA